MPKVDSETLLEGGIGNKNHGYYIVVATKYLEKLAVRVLQFLESGQPREFTPCPCSTNLGNMV